MQASVLTPGTMKFLLEAGAGRWVELIAQVDKEMDQIDPYADVVPEYRLGIQAMSINAR